ncbi:MAG: ATPase, T2SS/T4P/T4SS family [Pseudomonadota bacterium]
MVEAETQQQIAYAFAKDKGVVVLPETPGPVIGVRNGADPLALIEVRRALGKKLTLKSLDASDFEKALSEAYGGRDLDGGEAEAAMDANLESLVDGIPQTADLLDGDDDAPIIRLINGLIFEAVKRKASDIHIDPFEDKLSIRYRIDGALTEVLTPARKIAAPLVSRIKVMARLDIAEKRMPQDGRISLSLGTQSIDVRVATLPTRYGERVALRLLDTRNALIGLDKLGMDATTEQRYNDVLSQPNGVILVTGPVGSGKTTTLYASLSQLNTGEVNIMTLEDPVEYGLDGISQTQMDHKVGLTFAATLRSILRNDPNIVMVGEIRDGETADVALEFALTGRLALSTLHTNSSVSAITRLRDMGIESFLMASTLRAVLAQRLVRKLCSHCKEVAPADAGELAMLGLEPGTHVEIGHARGCLSCSNTGYEGRLGVYELLVIDGKIKELIHTGASEQDIEAYAFAEHDMLFENGRRLVLDGLTSVEEVLRVCRREARKDGRV